MATPLMEVRTRSEAMTRDSVGPLEVRGKAMRKTIFMFPDDVGDDAMRRLRDDYGLSDVFLAFSYHAVDDIHLARSGFERVHSRSGDLWFIRDRGRYERVLGARLPLAGNGGRRSLAALTESAAANGVRMWAWSTYLHIDRSTRRGRSRDPLGASRGYCLCPSSPAARDFAMALTEDMLRPEIAGVLAESLQFHDVQHGSHHERLFALPPGVLREVWGWCFCNHCLKRVRDRCIDAEGFRLAFLALVEDCWSDGELRGDDEMEDMLESSCPGALDAFRSMRRDVVMTLVDAVYQQVRSAGKRLVIFDIAGAASGFSSGCSGGSQCSDEAMKYGLDLSRIGSSGARIAAPLYRRDVRDAERDLVSYLEEVGGRCDAVLPILRPTWPDCSSLMQLKEKVAMVRERGVSEVAFYHYAFCSPKVLTWIGEC